MILATYCVVLCPKYANLKGIQDRPKHMKKKIVYVITKSNWGGAQRYVFDVATFMNAHGHETVVALGGTGPLKHELERNKIRVVLVNSLQRDISLVKEFAAFRELVRLFKSERPDVVHVNSSKAGGLGVLAARLTHVPRIIFTIHGPPFNENRMIIVKMAIKLVTWCTVLLSHSTITICKHDKESLAALPFIGNKVVLIYNGIDVPLLLEREGARIKLRFEYKVPTESFLIGTVAELHKNKGLRYIIEALASLPKRVALCVVGDGEEAAVLKERVRELGIESRVYFTGFIANASRFLKAFDVFVLPSVKEGLPYVLLEAGLASLPVVATDVGGVPEIIRDKKTGLLVQPKNSAKLAGAISFMMKSEKKRSAFGTALKTRVESQFSTQKMLGEVENLYKENH